MGAFVELFDVTLLATIGLIFFATLLGAYLRSRRRDPCLASFQGYQVTLEQLNNKIVWGRLELESTGLELMYRDGVQDANHIESSYILYGDEYAQIHAIFRYADDLDQENVQRRKEDIRRSFHPGPVRLMRRRLRQFVSMAAQSLNEVFGLIIGRLRKPAGRYITETGEAHLKEMGNTLIGKVGYNHDPLLERFVGKKVVVEMVEGDDEKHEHVGILKNYSADFLEILDVQYPHNQRLALEPAQLKKTERVATRLENGVLYVENLTEFPILLQSLHLDGTEEMLNAVVDGGETLELHPESRFDQAQLSMRVVRELDMIVPRTRCVVRHRADRYEPSLMPEIIFDLGVVLSGGSRLDAKEERLRRDLRRIPNSALLQVNLAAVLMQRNECEEAEGLLEKALRARYTLPDNGRRARMMLNECRRRRGEVALPCEEETNGAGGRVTVGV